MSQHRKFGVASLFVILAMVAVSCGQPSETGVIDETGVLTQSRQLTLEQAAAGAWTVENFIVVGIIKEVSPPFWNTSTGEPWDKAPEPEGPITEEGDLEGVSPFPEEFQRVTLAVEEWIKVESSRESSDELTLDHSVTFNGPFPALPGSRGLFIGIRRGEVAWKDGHLETLEDFSMQHSFIEVAPGVAIPLLESALDPRPFEARTEEAVKEGVGVATLALVSWDELIERVRNPDKPYEQHLGYTEIACMAPSTAPVVGGCP